LKLSVATEAPSGPRMSRDGLGLSAILFVALAVRAFAWSRTSVMFNDGPIFLAMAEAIGEGRWAEVLAHPYHPLYPALIALVGLFPIQLETAAVTVSILGGLLSVIAIFFFVRDAFGRELAWYAAWIVALHPWAVDFSSDVMSDGIYTGFFLLSFVAMARMVDHPTAINTLFCGVGGGLAYLVRPEGAGLLVAGVLLLGVRGFFDRAERSRRLVLACAGLLLAGAVVMVPFVMAVGHQTGEFVLTQKKSISSLVGAPEETGQARRASAQLSGPLPLPEMAIRADGEGASRPSRNMAGFLESIVRVSTTSLAALRFEVFGFAVLGLIAFRSNRKTLREWTIGLPIALYSGLLVLLVWGAGYVSRRHALAPLLPVIAFSALGWKSLYAMLAARSLGRGGSLIARLRTSRATGVVLVVVLVIAWGARDLRPRRLDRAPVRAAAEWLAMNHPKSGPVAAQKLRVAYYAGAEFVPLLSGNDGRLAHQLRSRHVRWIVIDEAKLGDHRGLEAGIGSWLQSVHSVSSGGRTVLVLAVDPEPAS
jgi:hypothetical protein